MRTMPDNGGLAGSADIRRVHGLLARQSRRVQKLENLLSSSATKTALPTNPTHGDEIRFVADSTNGVVWNLRYNANSGSAYKWEFIGGGSMTTTSSGNTTPADTAYHMRAAVTLPSTLGGDFNVVASARAVAVDAVAIYTAAIALGDNGVGSGTQNQQTLLQSAGAAGNLGFVTNVTSVTAGHTVEAGVGSSAANKITFSLVGITVTPIRVG